MGSLGKNRENQLSKDDIDAMKGLSAEEQFKKLSQVFNFYAMDDGGQTSGAER